MPPRTSRRPPAATSSSCSASVTTRRCSVSDGHGCWPMCSKLTWTIVPAVPVRCDALRDARRSAGPRLPGRAHRSPACSRSMASGRERHRLTTRRYACPSSWCWGSGRSEAGAKRLAERERVSSAARDAENPAALYLCGAPSGFTGQPSTAPMPARTLRLGGFWQFVFPTRPSS